MKEYTEDELRCKAESYCSVAERCPSEVKDKLSQWGADAAVSEQVLAHLVRERYIDEARFCRAFVRDKYRFARWGRVKIAQALRLKQLPCGEISAALEEIDEEEYGEGLERLLRQKGKTLSAKNSYERNAKLIRFAMGRGFTMDEVMRYVKQAETDGYLD